MMNRRWLMFAVLPLVVAFSSPALLRADEQTCTRTEDVIYGRKSGMALTLDVFTPKEKANGAAIVWVVSGGWFSDHAWISPDWIGEYLKRGYTVFAVVHGSQPRFTIPDAVSDLHRAVRFVRSKAADFKIDPERIGITGGSAGGHLSLMQGTAGSAGIPDANDPVERQSSRVQAVACFFPPTDFLNYGEPGNIALGTGILKDFRAPFDFKEFDAKSKTFVVITSDDKRIEIGKQISPVNHVSPDDPPTLIIHGDADKLVPIQQAEIIIEKLNQAKVPCELVVKKGAEHGWADITKDVPTLADWFDKYLAKKP